MRYYTGEVSDVVLSIAVTNVVRILQADPTPWFIHTAFCSASIPGHPVDKWRFCGYYFNATGTVMIFYP